MNKLERKLEVSFYWERVDDIIEDPEVLDEHISSLDELGVSRVGFELEKGATQGKLFTVVSTAMYGNITYKGEWKLKTNIYDEENTKRIIAAIPE